jgi:hypothetical protein|tara:strand:- start:1595 stop:1798 length:204 start_codon:yes stop_codon:yes gene_type:complete
MKWLMIITVCIGFDCSQITGWFDTQEECLAESSNAKQWFMTNYPDSHGEVYCVEADPSVVPQKGQPI